MASFYLPKRLDISGTPVIIYPSEGAEKVFDRSRKDCVELHIVSLYRSNFSTLLKGQYHIDIVWNVGNDRMTDVWIYDKIESWGSGPLADVKVFRGFEPETNIGVSAENGLIMLGREGEHRRKQESLKAYLDGSRPSLPDGIQPLEEFYLS